MQGEIMHLLDWQKSQIISRVGRMWGKAKNSVQGFGLLVGSADVGEVLYSSKPGLPTSISFTVSTCIFLMHFACNSS